MSELRFSVTGIAPEPYAASPALTAKVRIEETTGATVHSAPLFTSLSV